MSECHGAEHGRTPTLFGVLSWEEQTADELWPIKPVTKLALTERLCEIIVDRSSTNRDVIGAGRILHAVSKLNLEILRLLKTPEAPEAKLADADAQAAMPMSASEAAIGSVTTPTAGGNEKAVVPKQDMPVVEEVPFSELLGVSAARWTGEVGERSGLDFDLVLNGGHARRTGDRESELLGLPRTPIARRKRRRS